MIQQRIYNQIKEIIATAKQNSFNAINAQMLFAYWELGRIILEEEQKGEKRAEYGKALLQDLAQKLSIDFGKGFDERELRRIRQFYTVFPIRDTLRPELTWSHYRLIIRIEDNNARNYYINEAINQHWSTRVLDRNIVSQYYYRILAHKTTEPLIENDSTNNTLSFIKDPYVLEFLNLPNTLGHKEKDIEKAIIQHIKQFLLELGKGFAFVAQQKLIRTETSDFFIDLVFYNYILKCFVIIDIKCNKLSHQDIGQLDMYVRMYNDLEKTTSDNPTIGILLCADTDNIVAKYSVLSDNSNLFASQYQLYLPTENQLLEEMKKEIEKLDNQNLDI